MVKKPADSMDFDSDDDMPLGEMKKKAPAKKKVPAKKKSPAKKSKPAAKKSIPAKKAAAKKTTPAKKKPTPKKKPGPTAVKVTNAAPASSKFYATSEKGRMIQAILCRWWYGISWPSADALATPVPRGYESLDGFSGGETQ
ncbi:hypothetical protein TL16_g11160 [Triparma laevis f. inornata]|uniref:Uncharacterized protein n=1 Tax=Triparma laevis f. inornata TaxID=1714386 RepID=A0A9W7ERV2_9STRA|nr:hypothetical protein TL16_g11160 [Triparma laevis f. inornata]